MLSALLKTESITKRFPNVLANDNITLRVEKGELRALLGENGAGKTTFMNVVFGFYRPDSGRIFFNEEEVSFNSPLDAIKKGIYMVHQNFSLVRPFTVVENIALVPRLSQGLLTDLHTAHKQIEDIAAISGLQVDADATVEQLAVGVQQRVEIMKALASRARLLLLDEPTSVLTPQEVDQFLSLIRSLMKKEGLTVIMSTHKLSEALRFSDSVTILRQGRLVITEKAEALSEEAMVEYMIGKKMALDIARTPLNAGKALLQIEGLEVPNDRGILAVKGATFCVREGEIVGIAGVAGNGQKELEEAITGRRKAIQGKVRITGVDVTNSGAREISKMGVGIIPEDGYISGLNLNFTLAENSVLNQYYRKPFRGRYFLKHKEIENHCRKLITELDVRPPEPFFPASNLSGGNRQKLIVARELATNPKLLIASNPTRGLDVRTAILVRKKMMEIRERGGGVLLISDDLGEILSISDAIAVILRGQIVGTLDTCRTDATEVGFAMTGGRKS